MRVEWTCPFCSRDSIVTDANFSEDTAFLDIENAQGRKAVIVQFVVCPNPKCRKFTLAASMRPLIRRNAMGIDTGGVEKVWQLIPSSAARVFPAYVPKPILDDYTEACLISALSPKASATLSRRCLQGMIRDFWKVTKPNLLQEIDAVKDRVDAQTWAAIDAVRKIGNIGAHMEKDINVIVDVDVEEAAKLIWLVELLIKDWYVLRHERQERLKEIADMAKAKQEAKAGPPTPTA